MNAYNRKTLVVGVLIALAIAGVVSYFASGEPDGLEKSQEELGAAEPVHKDVEPPPSVFEEYRLACLGEGFWGNAVAGIAGSLLVLGLVLAAGHLLKRRERRAAGSPPRLRGAGCSQRGASPAANHRAKLM